MTNPILHAQPSAIVRQLSGADPTSGQPILTVVAKQTYRLDAAGRCRLHDEQVPLFEDLVIDDATEPGVVLHDADLYLHKPLTDVVVLGHAYALRGERSFTAGVVVGTTAKSLQVFGDRRCGRTANGQIVFSDPTPCDRVPLRYDRAYGGRDAVAEAAHGNPFMPLQPYMQQVDLTQASPFVYPRNACGKGYLIEARPEAIDALELPNLEDPADLLRPSTIVVGDPNRWSHMPLPWCTSWVDPGSFPRLACLGAIPEPESLAHPLAEVRRGFYPAQTFVTTNAAGQPKPLEERFSPLFANGASLGLAVPKLRGDEEILLGRLHPQVDRYRFRLPGQVPEIWVDGRDGKLVETKPTLASVVIEPDESRLTVVWSGSAPAKRLYGPDELQTMPLRVKW